MNNEINLPITEYMLEHVLDEDKNISIKLRKVADVWGVGKNKWIIARGDTNIYLYKEKINGLFHFFSGFPSFDGFLFDSPHKAIEFWSKNRKHIEINRFAS